MNDYLIVAHRVNTIEGLKGIPEHYGVEIDVRHDNTTGKLYLNHKPGTGEYLDEWLESYQHAFIVFNIKEVGIEQKCIELAEKFGVPRSNYFLLDVEFPYLYSASRNLGVREIAVRYSEAEPIEATLAQREFVDWVWIDTNTRLPLDKKTVSQLEGFKTCLVAPDRWGRPEDNTPYRKQIERLHFPLTAVMVGMEYAHLWE